VFRPGGMVGRTGKQSLAFCSIRLSTGVFDHSATHGRLTTRPSVVWDPVRV